MMQSILTREPVEETPAPEEATEAADFEIVLGTRQLAGVLFLAIVFLVVFSAVSYIAGEAMSPRRAAAAERPGPIAAAVAAPAVEAPPKPVPVQQSPVEAPPLQQGSVFADPKIGELYLQIGAVDKGTATIMVEGLRTHGFDAFAASGPSEKVFRVLIGPFADQDAFHRTKNAVDDLGVTAFARRYEP